MRSSTPQPGSSRDAALIAVLAFAGLSSTFMFSLVIPIQAQLPRLLDAARDDTAWVITVTVLASAVVTPIAGRLGDLYGKRRVMLGLVAVMTTGSLLAAVVVGLPGMIVARAMQGVMAGVIPLGIAVIRDEVAAQRLPTAIALVSATLGIGGGGGLVAGATIAQTMPWRMLFWLSAALGAVVFVLVVGVVRESPVRATGRFDVWGALGLAAGIATLLLALTRGAVWGWGSAPTIVLGAGGVLILLVWVRYQLSATEPLLDLRAAARRPVILTNLVSLTLGFGLFASNVIYPQILVEPASTGVGFELPLIAASLAVMPSGIVVLLISPLCGRLSALVGPRIVLVAGAAAILAAYTMSFFLHREVWQIVVANVLVGVGIAFSLSAVPLLIIRSVAQVETGALNGLNALHRSVGTTIAAAAVGVVLASFTVPGMPGHPSADGFRIAFAMAAAGAALAIVVALFLPAVRSGGSGPADAPDQGPLTP